MDNVVTKLVIYATKHYTQVMQGNSHCFGKMFRRNKLGTFRNEFCTDISSGISNIYMFSIPVTEIKAIMFTC